MAPKVGEKATRGVGRNGALLMLIYSIPGIFSLVLHLSMLIVGILYKDDCELNVREYIYDTFHLVLKYCKHYHLQFQANPKKIAQGGRLVKEADFEAEKKIY